MDITKFVLGLASGSIALLVGSTIVSSGPPHVVGRLPSFFASPLCLLGLSILYGIFFMVFMNLSYEAYLHKTRPYSSFLYSWNQALGFSCLLSFGVGYAWLIVNVIGPT